MVSEVTVDIDTLGCQSVFQQPQGYDWGNIHMIRLPQYTRIYIGAFGVYSRFNTVPVYSDVSLSATAVRMGRQ